MNSYWIESIKDNKNEFPCLEEDIETDVCIIGGGLTGITTAYYLSKTDLNVTVLEKYKICEHTSGNTTAKITSQHGLFYEYLIQSQGEQKAKQYLRANEEAINNIEEIVKKEDIQCDFERQNNYVYTRQEKEIDKIKREVEAVRSLGFPAEFVTELELPFEILGAIKFPNQAQFNPCKYVNGLVEKIYDKENVSIFENTKVVDLKSLGDIGNKERNKC